MIFVITEPGLILKSNTLKINIIVKDVKFEKKIRFQKLSWKILSAGYVARVCAFYTWERGMGPWLWSPAPYRENVELNVIKEKI